MVVKERLRAFNGPMTGFCVALMALPSRLNAFKDFNGIISLLKLLKAFSGLRSLIQLSFLRPATHSRQTPSTPSTYSGMPRSSPVTICTILFHENQRFAVTTSKRAVRKELRSVHFPSEGRHGTCLRSLLHIIQIRTKTAPLPLAAAGRGACLHTSKNAP